MSSVLPGRTTALVLVDLQHWIVAMPWAPIGGIGVVEACIRLRDGFAEAEAPVVLVRYLRANSSDGGGAAESNRLVPALEPRPGEHLVTKRVF
ncbi:MAG: hypothetical protein DLM55_04485 [Acidimicrobiales bacterium]|nr:MAG: hypothetical protein DLM55_04485 [Acidimicrobiales bacterium]